ncbi:MAG TPA: hypothetical protein VG778_09650 [Blastocatellia bacterium]|jgi:ligand-binding sensor domain-containing protein|nr:hypothetical protein [Blastocatellia bacterium]
MKFLDSIKANRARTVSVAVLVCAVVVLVVFLYFAKINEQIGNDGSGFSAAARVEFTTDQLRAPSTDGYSVYLNSGRVRATALFKGNRYMATSGGLAVLDSDGSVTRIYTTLDGLSDNDLTALAVFASRLFIGTSSAGLMEFDGDSFTSHRFSKPKATRVRVLTATDSELLIGTQDGGLLQYDGESFSRFVNAATGADFKSVTALLPYESRLYIGTQDRGLYLWREGHIEHVGTAEGLPSPNVTGLAALPDGFSEVSTIAVATDFGVVGLDDLNRTELLSTQANITSIASAGGKLWAGLFGGGVVELSKDPAKRNDRSLNESGESTTRLPQVPATVLANEGKLWALTDHGVYVRDEDSSRPVFEATAEELIAGRVLTGDHITGLSFDEARRLWVGFFDRGVDVIAPESSERLSHIEDDRVREVNFLAYDPRDGRMLVATSRGLVVFDARMRQTVYTREANGIVNDSVAHVSITDSPSAGANARGALVLATGGGLTEISGGRARSITAFHGMGSNHLYTSAVSGSRLFVGSLAGLVEIEGLRVVRTFKTSNSGLSHDWVTALGERDGTLYIGTNGGGVDALLPTGEWVNVSDELGRFEVNQNALRVDGERIYVGTANRGLLIYNSRARRWTRISAGLPSQNVTAIATDELFVYAGTLNGLARIEKRVIE